MPCRPSCYITTHKLSPNFNFLNSVRPKLAPDFTSRVMLRFKEPGYRRFQLCVPERFLGHIQEGLHGINEGISSTWKASKRSKLIFHSTDPEER